MRYEEEVKVGWGQKRGKERHTPHTFCGPIKGAGIQAPDSGTPFTRFVAP